MNTSPETYDQNEEPFEATGIQESISIQEEGNGPPCFGCNKPTKIQNGHFFCTNKARTNDNSFACPLQVPMGDAEVTQYIPEEIRKKAIEAEANNFPNDEVEPLYAKEERDFSHPNEFNPDSGFSEPLESIETPGTADDELKTFEKLGDNQPIELTTEEESVLSKLEEYGGNKAIEQDINTANILGAARALKSVGVSGFDEIIAAGEDEKKQEELVKDLPAESKKLLYFRAGLN